MTGAKLGKAQRVFGYLGKQLFFVVNPNSAS